MRTINVDLDGVVYDFVATLAGKAAGVSQFQREYPRPTRFDFWVEWGMTEGEWRAIFNLFVQDNGYRYGPPVSGASHGLWVLSDRGWDIRIVTKRLNQHRLHQNVIIDTVEWLDTANIPYRSISFLGDEPKADYRAYAFIDDNIENLPENYAGVKILMDQPWNYGQDRDDVIRVADWREAVAVIGSPR